MPVIEIRALPQKGKLEQTEIMKKLCQQVAAAASVTLDHTSATWVTISPGSYVHGDNSAADQPEDTHPPIVKVISFEGKSGAEIEDILNTVSTVLTTELHLDQGNVFVVYEEIRSGYVHSGGKVVTLDNYD